MGRMGGKKHLKALAAPRTWKIKRKEHVWATKPVPGPHSKERAVPLIVLLRDYLGVVETRREGEKIIKAGYIKVDNRVIKEPRFPLGFMDTLQVGEKKYRALYDKKGRITLKEIESGEDVKLCRIENKTLVKGGKIQLNLHDGRNILTDNNEYKTGDVLLISLPDQKILKHIPMKEGCAIYVIGGKHTGATGKIKEIIPGTMTRKPQITIESEGKEYTTLKSYVFVIGEEKPEIDVIV